LEEAPYEAPAYDVPYLPDIVIDGDASEWNGRGTVLSGLVFEDAPPERAFPPAEIRLGWNENGLVVLVEVQDEPPYDVDRAEQWKGDGVELFWGAEDARRNRVQTIAVPNDDKPEGWLAVVDHRMLGLEADMIVVVCEPAITEDGYRFEFLLPFKPVRVEPKEGEIVRFQVRLNDRKVGEERQQMWFFPAYASHSDGKLMHRLRLTQSKSEHVAAGIRWDETDLESLAGEIWGQQSLAGNTVALVNERGELFSRKLIPRGGRAYAEVELPAPEPGSTYGPIKLLSGSQKLADVYLPDLNEERRERLGKVEIELADNVLKPGDRPEVSAQSKARFEAIAGRSNFRYRVFDESGQEAGRLPKKGSATVRLSIESGLGEETRWFPVYVSNNSEPASDEEAVIALSGESMNQRRPEWMPPEQFANLQNERLLHRAKRSAGDRQDLPMAIYLPRQDQKPPLGGWPLLLYLHPEFEREPEDLAILKREQIVRTYEEGLPRFVLAVPILPNDEDWSTPRVEELIETLLERLPIDPGRVWLTGSSAGGSACWFIGQDIADRLEGIIPLSSIVPESPNLEALQSLVVAAHHCPDDEVAPFEPVEQLVHILKFRGADASLYAVQPEHAGFRHHFIDDHVYAEPFTFQIMTP
jgi:hypothetical protein